MRPETITYQMNLVVLDGHTLNPGDLSWQAVEQFGRLTVYPRTQPEEIVYRSAEADILMTNKTPLTAETIHALPRLKLICVLATGYNVVDTTAARKNKIAVCNIPSYSTESVAQAVFAHLLNITNRVEYYANENKKGRWSNCTDFCYCDTKLFELQGKKLGIVGLGNIGSATARIALAFGMKVCALTSKSQKQLGKDIYKIEMNELFRTCDVITLNCPLTPQTNQMINSKCLKTMKPSAILINTGRGGLINEFELAEALNNGTIAGYGADVLAIEPPALDNPLLTARNSFITPHISWATREARTRLMNILVDNIKAFLSASPINVINS